MLGLSHRFFRTDNGLKRAILNAPYKPVGSVCREPVFLENNVISKFVKKTDRQANFSFTPFGDNELRDSILNLIVENISNEIRNISIRQLDGLKAGKTDDKSDYRDLNEFSLKLVPPREFQFRGGIGFQTEKDFRTNIKYIKKHVNKISYEDDGLFRVVHRTWDDKRFLLNMDGAHHIAAIFRQCMEQDRDYLFKAKLTKLEINHKNCQYILNRCYPLILEKSTTSEIYSILRDFDFGVAYREDYFAGYIFPKNYTAHNIFYISKKANKSDFIYQTIIKSIDRKYYFDLYEYLESILNK